MLHTRYLLRLLCLLFALTPAACEQADEEALYTELSIRFVMPDSRPVERLEIVGEHSYFDNINSYERTPFPAVERDTATVRLRRGVYTFTVEAYATYDSGRRQLLRCADHNQVMQAVTWVHERETVVLLFQAVN